ncbi:DGQHR domain-containing protein [Thermicanus aegyptius]|uniref:DGQHR domain-containing protein n=1 Tax=Thermicanus aegyptius TaxID=94009 RepID=UPI000418CCF1|nr:DGQHR domain-containing protein [Thermicanus aegyptius]
MVKSDTSGIAAILVTQGEFRFYIAAMPSYILRETCFTITREADPKEGFQRVLNEERAKKIATYIDSGSGSIPTAIILSAQPQSELKYNSKSKTISFKNDEKAFLIIDGQHRVYGFIKANQSIRVPVVIYEELTRVQEARLFIDINTNQEQVPEALLLDVKTLLKNETEDEKRCSELFDIFYNHDSSVLKGKLDRATRTQGKISRITFNKSVIELLKNELKELPMEKSYIVINNYLKACQKVFTEIDSRLSNLMYKPVSFEGLLRSAKAVIDKATTKYDKLSYETFYDVVKVLKDNISKERLLRPGNSPKRFSESIIQGITTIYIRPNSVVED